MAEETAMNGVDDQATENFYDSDQTAELSRKVEILEQEKLKLAGENEETKEKIKKLTIEIEKGRSDESELKERLREMEKEIESFEEDKKALGAIAARAADLETEVSRLQHDLITAMSEGGAASAEVEELKRVLREKEAKIGSIESEVESLKTTKAESEKRVRELERKIGVLEMKEIEEKSKRVRAEEEMREQMEEQERQIVELKKVAVDLESLVSDSGAEAEKWVMERVTIEAALKESVEKAKAMEAKVHYLQKEVEKAETVVREVKDKTVKVVNGAVDDLYNGREEKGLNLQWPVVAGSAGAAIVAGAAVLYVLYGRRR
ncbi:peroxisomal and mitochondrial division factor 2-like [Humulus lupulus]|uniref:peroxisomal and mitochondrial division factor 2-like n=1 Tax=Humulus lupulus TaxID=3486 RepID=UPI002B40D054|nr:peroxisomal and mitochondrial division factor 2-like [Humulus lupulus]XP_062105763.1 peroxisomal and mitochondrial division factor 2-like [Humulus lupulus]